MPPKSAKRAAGDARPKKPAAAAAKARSKKAQAAAATATAAVAAAPTPAQRSVSCTQCRSPITLHPGKAIPSICPSCQARRPQSAGRALLVETDDMDDDICPVCDGDCTCHKASASSAASSAAFPSAASAAAAAVAAAAATATAMRYAAAATMVSPAPTPLATSPSALAHSHHHSHPLPPLLAAPLPTLLPPGPAPPAAKRRKLGGAVASKGPAKGTFMAPPALLAGPHAAGRPGGKRIPAARPSATAAKTRPGGKHLGTAAVNEATDSETETDSVTTDEDDAHHAAMLGSVGHQTTPSSAAAAAAAAALLHSSAFGTPQRLPAPPPPPPPPPAHGAVPRGKTLPASALYARKHPSAHHVLASKNVLLHGASAFASDTATDDDSLTESATASDDTDSDSDGAVAVAPPPALRGHAQAGGKTVPRAASVGRKTVPPRTGKTVPSHLAAAAAALPPLPPSAPAASASTPAPTAAAPASSAAPATAPVKAAAATKKRAPKTAAEPVKAAASAASAAAASTKPKKGSQAPPVYSASKPPKIPTPATGASSKAASKLDRLSRGDFSAASYRRSRDGDRDRDRDRGRSKRDGSSYVASSSALRSTSFPKSVAAAVAAIADDTDSEFDSDDAAPPPTVLSTSTSASSAVSQRHRHRQARSSSLSGSSQLAPTSSSSSSLTGATITKAAQAKASASSSMAAVATSSLALASSGAHGASQTRSEGPRRPQSLAAAYADSGSDGVSDTSSALSSVDDVFLSSSEDSDEPPRRGFVSARPSPPSSRKPPSHLPIDSNAVAAMLRDAAELTSAASGFHTPMKLSGDDEDDDEDDGIPLHEAVARRLEALKREAGFTSGADFARAASMAQHDEEEDDRSSVSSLHTSDFEESSDAEQHRRHGDDDPDVDEAAAADRDDNRSDTTDSDGDDSDDGDHLPTTTSLAEAVGLSIASYAEVEEVDVDVDETALDHVMALDLQRHVDAALDDHDADSDDDVDNDDDDEGDEAGPVYYVVSDHEDGFSVDVRSSNERSRRRRRMYEEAASRHMAGARSTPILAGSNFWGYMDAEDSEELEDELEQSMADDVHPQRVKQGASKAWKERILAAKYDEDAAKTPKAAGDPDGWIVQTRSPSPAPPPDAVAASASAADADAAASHPSSPNVHAASPQPLSLVSQPLPSEATLVNPDDHQQLAYFDLHLPVTGDGQLDLSDAQVSRAYYDVDDNVLYLCDEDDEDDAAEGAAAAPDGPDAMGAMDAPGLAAALAQPLDATTGLLFDPSAFLGVGLGFGVGLDAIKPYDAACIESAVAAAAAAAAMSTDTAADPAAASVAAKDATSGREDDDNATESDAGSDAGSDATARSPARDGDAASPSSLLDIFLNPTPDGSNSIVARLEHAHLERMQREAAAAAATPMSVPTTAPASAVGSPSAAGGDDLTMSMPPLSLFPAPKPNGMTPVMTPSRDFVTPGPEMLEHASAALESVATTPGGARDASDHASASMAAAAATAAALGLPPTKLRDLEQLLQTFHPSLPSMGAGGMGAGGISASSLLQKSNLDRLQAGLPPQTLMSHVARTPMTPQPSSSDATTPGTTATSATEPDGDLADDATPFTGLPAPVPTGQSGSEVSFASLDLAAAQAAVAAANAAAQAHAGAGAGDGEHAGVTSATTTTPDIFDTPNIQPFSPNAFPPGRSMTPLERMGAAASIAASVAASMPAAMLYATTPSPYGAPVSFTSPAALMPVTSSRPAASRGRATAARRASDTESASDSDSSHEFGFNDLVDSEFLDDDAVTAAFDASVGEDAADTKAATRRPLLAYNSAFSRHARARARHLSTRAKRRQGRRALHAAAAGLPSGLPPAHGAMLSKPGHGHYPGHAHGVPSSLAPSVALAAASMASMAPSVPTTMAMAMTLPTTGATVHSGAARPSRRGGRGSDGRRSVALRGAARGGPIRSPSEALLRSATANGAFPSEWAMADDDLLGLIM
ncbi:hypothetical protein CXG81DRAFT_17200 [Caulochytrium protostelioides]|uniref:Uncharacterized protein n=1 Tax=Caulochytrium protostelioides TaxID=1555241 RepID=A0A4V1IV92_9FUNG|nr:hypothetical protein CXG81DRAFT_17200 [Caulochytrium protostelioides]|eukprot:RKP03249.1 hypothetical protein CXG81DRAFT_17200 [Caulochytrium protostelioides]